jgi:hypothetical protein
MPPVFPRFGVVAPLSCGPSTHRRDAWPVGRCFGQQFSNSPIPSGSSYDQVYTRGPVFPGIGVATPVSCGPSNQPPECCSPRGRCWSTRCKISETKLGGRRHLCRFVGASRIGRRVGQQLSNSPIPTESPVAVPHLVNGSAIPPVHASAPTVDAMCAWLLLSLCIL